MGRNLNQIIADLPADRQVRIDARYREMKDEVEEPCQGNELVLDTGPAVGCDHVSDSL
jgi:hypothetical protein